MKFINLIHRITLVIVLVVSYSGLAVSSDRAVKVYTVEINGIPFWDDIAETLVLLITNGGKSNIKVHDNIQNTDTSLSHVTENMNVTIRGNELLSAVSDLYKNFFEKKNADYKYSKMGEMSCISGDKKLTKGVKICVDDGGTVSYFEN
jgi:hypothetical protein